MKLEIARKICHDRRTAGRLVEFFEFPEAAKKEESLEVCKLKLADVWIDPTFSYPAVIHVVDSKAEGTFIATDFPVKSSCYSIGPAGKRLSETAKENLRRKLLDDIGRLIDRSLDTCQLKETHPHYDYCHLHIECSVDNVKQAKALIKSLEALWNVNRQISRQLLKTLRDFETFELDTHSKHWERHKPAVKGIGPAFAGGKS